MPRASTLQSRTDQTISELNRVMDARRRQQAHLAAQWSKLLSILKDVGAAIEDLGGAGEVAHVSTSRTETQVAAAPRRGRRGKRPHNERSLVEALEDALRKIGKPANISEIMTAVEAGGYRSSSDNFRGIINQTLIKERARFSNVGHGVYQLKK